jgi:type IV pilus assembly protein PilM
MLFARRYNSLGIDIGTTSIKIVELGRSGDNIELKNYAEYHRVHNKKTFPFQTNSFSFFEEEVAEKLKALLKAAMVDTKEATFSLPSFSGFFTTLDLPKMPLEEIEEAVKYQSYQYIPLPLQEVFLDWTLMQGEGDNENKIKILLAAIPKDLVEKYKNVARMVGISIKALEIESFAEARSLLGDNKDPVVIVNIGDRATNIIVVDNGYVRVSHSLEYAGFHVTKTLSQGLDVSFVRAEELKQQRGLQKEVGSLVSMPIFSVVDKIIFGMQKAANVYLSKTPNKQIQKIILSGGTAKMPGLVDYFNMKTQIKTEVGQPFYKINFQESLKSTIENIGPSFSVAVGLALRDFTKN